MATVKVRGLDELSAAIDKLGDVPFSVISEALVAMGKTGAGILRQTGEAMGVRDPFSGVHILDKITVRKPKQTEDGGVIYVGFSGSRKRGNTKTSNTEIAFLNEYGREGQQARPFVRVTAEAYPDLMAAPGEKIIGDWQEKTFADGGRS